MSEAETKERVEIATKPPGRWRNWWRNNDSTRIGSRCRRCGFTKDTTPFLTFATCCKTYPDRDTAETHAARLREVKPQSFGEIEYLGAYPEGETP